jgi:hypothetical protein
MSSIDTLVEQWGEDDVYKAFWLQEHIKEQGIDGIGYMAAARAYLEKNGNDTTRREMKSQMDERY